MTVYMVKFHCFRDFAGIFFSFTNSGFNKSTPISCNWHTRTQVRPCFMHMKIKINLSFSLLTWKQLIICGVVYAFRVYGMGDRRRRRGRVWWLLSKSIQLMWCVQRTLVLRFVLFLFIFMIYIFSCWPNEFHINSLSMAYPSIILRMVCENVTSWLAFYHGSLYSFQT